MPSYPGFLMNMNVPFQSVKADNYGRRTWDREEYEKAAKARQVAEKAARKQAEKESKFDLYAAKSSKDDDESGSGSEAGASDHEKEDREGGFEDWDFSGRDHRERGSSSSGPPIKRELLQRRDYKVDLDSKLGKSVVITKNTNASTSGGWAVFHLPFTKKL